MKILPLILLLSFLTACNYKSTVDKITLPPEKSKIISIQLADSLGNITLTLPTRYDTSFIWTDYSDCGKPCNKIKYRWQPKNLKITKESGWIWLNEPKDSIERFTISHSGYFPFHNNIDSLFIVSFHNHERNDTAQFEPYKINSDTVEKIGNRYFSIFTIDSYDTSKAQFSKKLLAATNIKGNIIHIDFELLTKSKNLSTDNFINNSKFYLSTIGISNAK